MAFLENVNLTMIGVISIFQALPCSQELLILHILNFCMFPYFAYFPTYPDGKAKANRQDLRTVADFKNIPQENTVWLERLLKQTLKQTCISKEKI